MMKLSRIIVVSATVAAVGVTSTLGTSAIANADPSSASAVTLTAAPGDGPAGADGRTLQERRPKYKVRPGVTFNHPGYGPKKAYAIVDKIKETIAHTRKGERIRAMSWNFTSSGIMNRLISAHRRGVSVQFIMARSLSGTSQFRRLTTELRKGNKRRPPAMRSFTRTCSHSCRGGGGAMHSKFMTISKVGASPRVVMQGSSNFTATAASAQWNDWFTTVGNAGVYKYFLKEFKLSLRDRNSSLKDRRLGDITGWMAPRKAQPDLVLQLLNQVKCKGARGAGSNGRTTIRIASAVWQNDRGQAIGRKVAQLQRAGCNIRVVFTMMTQIIRNTMRSVPKRHLVYDYNGDGSFDRYLHMKAMSISGHVGKKRNARVVFNGSANWSTLGQISDEQGMIIRRDKIERQYSSWINTLYNNAPLGYRTLPTAPRPGYDPYAELELELE